MEDAVLDVLEALLVVGRLHHQLLSLRLQVGSFLGDDDAEEPDGTSGSKRKYSKRLTGRALVRVPSTDQVPLFPLDNSPVCSKSSRMSPGASRESSCTGRPPAVPAWMVY